MAEAMLGLAAVGVDVLRLDAAPFLWKRARHELPEPARGPRAAAGLPRGDADRRPRGRLQGRGDRRAARPRPLPRHRPPRGQGVRPRLPQRARWSCCWSALALGRGGADDEHAAGDAAGPARRGLADLRALPRRHRLGDHARGRRPRSARTRTCTGASWPTSTPATSPARSPAAPASSPTRAPARRGPPAPAPSLAGLESAPDAGRAGARRPAHPAAARGRLRPRRAAADLHGRRARPAQRRVLPRRPAQARRQPLDAPPRDGLGRRPSAATTRRRSKAGCGRACSG